MVSPVKLTMNGTLPVRCLGIKDQSGLAKIALFENLAEQSYMPNTTVQISGVYSKTYNKKPQLAVSKQTQFQFISNDAVPVTVDDTDIDTFQLDGDFAVQDKDEQLVYTVDALYEVASYTACSGQTCRKKKLVEGVCPTCEGTEGNWTLRCKLSVVREGFSRDVTLFEGDLMKLFGQLPQEADEDLLFTMVDMLPVDFTAKFSGTSFYNITKQ